MIFAFGYGYLHICTGLLKVVNLKTVFYIRSTASRCQCKWNQLRLRHSELKFALSL